MYGTWLILPIFFPLLGGLMASQITTLRVRRPVVSAILVLELVLVLPTVFFDAQPYTALELVPGVRIVLQADPLGRLFAVLVCVIWFCAAFFAYEYMNHEGHRERFFGFFLMTLGALMGICFAGNLVTLYLFYELMALCSVPLVLHIGTRKAFDAAWWYLAFSVAGASLGLLGQFFLQGYCTTDLFTPGGVLDPQFAAQDRSFLLVVFLVMAVGFGCKAGMFPLHAWLPLAHPVAPAPASAVLSGLITKMGVLAILRVAYYLYGWEFLSGTWVQRTVLTLALITILMGSTLALREDTLKKRLAYSTVSQVSYVVYGLMLLNPAALEGALFQAVFHAIAKNALFMATGAIIYKTHLTQVSQMRGVGTAYGISMWFFAIASLSLVGIPPTGGFLSKWMLAQGALDAGLGLLSYGGIAILMVSALLTAGYLLPIVTQAFFPGKDFDRSHVVKQQDTWLMWITVFALTVAVVLLGMFPGLLQRAVDSVVGPLFPV
ncbi:MAG: proton-conducting membrane transporter [Lawsonibacter sp.]|nr:proton-conducting membrane transporter [Lawsonibacter sp.]